MPLTDLIAEIRASVPLPVVGAGGVATADAVAGVLAAGAEAALADPARTETVVTRAFSGRPARGLRNTFIDTYEAGTG